jgi:hypothetical protein
MTPGPTEPTAEELQNYLKLIVDDLLKLYEEGVWICTPAFPQGAVMIGLAHHILLTIY